MGGLILAILFPRSGQALVVGDINGIAENDTIVGNGGHSTIRGLGGRDLILPGVGEVNGIVTLDGGDGNDTIAAPETANTRFTSFYIGGEGRDLLTFAAADSALRISSDGAMRVPVSTRSPFISILDIEHIEGSAFDDTMTGFEQPDVFLGFLGNDSILGGEGDDRLFGDGGDDTLLGDDAVTAGADVLDGGDGIDRLEGRAGADRLRGGNGSDILLGGDGNDTLVCGGGDSLTGGAGADRFRFDAASGAGGTPDLITDFTPGEDRIVLRRIDADPDLPGDQAFGFLGAQPFTGDPGQLRVQQIDLGVISFTVVTADIDGDARTDLVIQLSGLVALGADDFAL